LIALYQAPSKQTLIFEEPEKGIHPGALAVLADQFKACPEAGRGQVILTTHSPGLLDSFDPDSLRVVKIENYLTQIGPAATE
jgi:predicted ATPase